MTQKTKKKSEDRNDGTKSKEKKLKVKKYSNEDHSDTKSEKKNESARVESFKVPATIVLNDDILKNKNTGNKIETNVQKRYEKNVNIDNEWTPDINDDSAWEIVCDEKGGCTNYYKYTGVIPETEFTITKDFLEEIDKMIEKKMSDNNENNAIYNENDGVNVIKIFKYYDDKNECISYTSIQMIASVKNRLISNKNVKKSELNIFSSMENVKCKLIDCYKCLGKPNSSIVTQFKNKHKKNENKNKDIVCKNSNNTESNVNNIVFWSDYMQSLMSDDIKNDITKKNYTIYRIFNRVDDSKQYIFGSFTQYHRKDITAITYKYNLCFGGGVIDIEKLDEMNCCLECEGGIKTDYYISKHNSISNGLNRHFNIFLQNCTDSTIVKDTIFLIVQGCVMDELYFDDHDYKKIGNYIALIMNEKGDIYVFGSDGKSLKYKLKYFYAYGRQNNDKKLIDILSNTPFRKLKIDIIENNVDELELRLPVISRVCDNDVSPNTNSKNNTNNKKFSSLPIGLQNHILMKKMMKFRNN
jgi:hypothetical protein